MVLAACPNCSSCSPLLDSPIIRRPETVQGRHKHKWYISGCCAFSSKSRLAYETEQAASDAWDAYRAKAGQAKPFLIQSLAALDAHEAAIKSKLQRAESAITK